MFPNSKSFLHILEINILVINIFFAIIYPAGHFSLGVYENAFYKTYRSKHEQIRLDMYIQVLHIFITVGNIKKVASHRCTFKYETTRRFLMLFTNKSNLRIYLQYIHILFDSILKYQRFVTFRSCKPGLAATKNISCM